MIFPVSPLLICAITLGLVYQPDDGASSAAAPVVRAERMFADRHREVPLKQAFLEYSDPHGVALTRDGVRSIKEELHSWPEGRGPGVIDWWPEYAGMAASGELGFTTGPAVYGGGKAKGYYFTIWQRQADGKWLWLIDFGTRPKPSDGLIPSPGAVEEISTSRTDPVPVAGTWDDLLDLDARLGQDLQEEPLAFAAHFAPRGRTMGFVPDLAAGDEAVRKALAHRPAGMRTTPAGGGVSAAGDLGWTYGHVQWREAGEQPAAGYLRVWQRQSGRWLLLVENVSPL